MKKVAIIVKNLTSGGAEKQSVLLAYSLSNNYTIYYIIFNGKIFDEKYLNTLNRSENIKIIHCSGNLIKKIFSLVKLLRKENIIAIFSYLTAANIYATIIGKLSNSRIYTGIRNSKLPFWKEFIETIITNLFSTKTILNSHISLDYFGKRKFNASKMLVIPNCIDPILPYKGENKQNQIFTIITIGRFVTQKDYKTALLTISELKKNVNLQFIIVGYGILEEQIRAWIKELSLENEVIIYINPKNIDELLNNADVYLSTSIFEGTSNSIMEAMNANLPIIATNVGDNNLLVKNEINGFLHNVKDYKNMANSLYKLYADRSLLKEMSLKSKTILIENYSLDIFRNKYIDIIKK